MKNFKKIVSIVLVVMMMVTFSACAAQASEPVSQETVKKVQEALNEAGFECGVPDGIAGNNTKNAISEYQKRKGLDVTGEIDDELLKSMFPPEESQVVSSEETAAESTAATETQETEKVTEVATSAEAVETTKVAEGAEASDESFRMNEEDAMYYTCPDNVRVKLRIEGGDVVLEVVDMDNQFVRELSRWGASTGTNDVEFVKYIAEKYFYSARDVEEGREPREVVGDYQELRNPNLVENKDYFDWVATSDKLEFVFSDGIPFFMAVNPDEMTLWVIHSSKLGGPGRLLSFNDETSFKETQKFMDDTFIIARMMEDPSFELEY